jgi:hypothetical protein
MEPLVRFWRLRMMIINPGGQELRLPTESECRTAFAARGLEVAEFQDRAPRDRTGYSYPRVYVLTACGRLFSCDLYHGGGLLFEEV